MKTTIRHKPSVKGSIMSQGTTTARLPLPTAPGSVIWAYAGGTHWALFARDGQNRNEAFISEHGENAIIHNWVALDPSMTWVNDDDITAWEPRFIPSPAESIAAANLPVPDDTLELLPTASGTIIWAYSTETNWSLFGRGDGPTGATNWVSLNEEAKFLFDDAILNWEFRYHPSPAESQPQLGLPTYHLEDGEPVATSFDRRLLS